MWFGFGGGDRIFGGGDADAVDPITILMATPIVNGADSILGSVVRIALDRAILESPYVRVMPPNELADVFASMGREPTAAFDQATALELAERSGAGAVVVPTLTLSGTTYFLHATVLAPDGEQRAIAADRKSVV